MKIRTRENNKYITLYIPSFEVFYNVIKRITNEIQNKDFESFKRYNFESDIVKCRFKKFYEDNINETVSLRKIKYNCNAKNFNVLSKDFYLERGWDEDYAIKKISETQHDRSLKSAEKMTDDRQPAQIGYWLKKGYSLEEAKKQLHIRQCTFSREKCIEKYGIEKGLIIFEQRQKKWQNTIYERYSLDEISKWKQNSKFASREACQLFKPFFNMLKEKYKCYMYDSSENVKEFFLWDNELNRLYCYDFTITNLKLIFEYNGKHVHPDPRMSEEEWLNWRQCFTGKTADEVKKYYDRKIKIAEQHGFKVVQLWNYMNKEELNSIISSEIQAIEQSLQQQCPLHE